MSAPQHNLNPDQFQALHRSLNDPDEGGFTIHAQTGNRPSSGWMVADPTGEARMPAGTATPAVMENYVSKNAARLRAPDKHFGGWRESGEDFLDRSTLHPETEAGHGSAFAHMVTNHQKAMTRLSDLKSDTNPLYQEGDTAHGRLTKLAEAAKPRKLKKRELPGTGA